MITFARSYYLAAAPAALALCLSSAALAALATPAAADSASASLTLSITVRPSATVSLSTGSVAWSSVAAVPASADSLAAPLAADGGPVRVSGFLRTSAAGGSGSLMVVAPADLTGATNPSDVVPISRLSISCSGGGNSGVNAQPQYGPAFAPLRSGASTTCASWGSDAMVRVNVDLGIYLDAAGIPADSYVSSGFAVVATAT